MEDLKIIINEFLLEKKKEFDNNIIKCEKQRYQFYIINSSQLLPSCGTKSSS